MVKEAVFRYELLPEQMQEGNVTLPTIKHIARQYLEQWALWDNKWRNGDFHFEGEKKPVKQILVFNQTDCVEEHVIDELRKEFPHSIFGCRNVTIKD